MTFLKFQTQFVSDTLIPALELDALKNSHPIEVEVGHPCEVEEIFDSISYNKGASVIRMLHDYIGNDAFKQGMKHYLTTHSYKNTQTEDLWASLETASGKPVGKGKYEMLSLFFHIFCDHTNFSPIHFVKNEFVFMRLCIDGKIWHNILIFQTIILKT